MLTAVKFIGSIGFQAIELFLVCHNKIKKEVRITRNIWLAINHVELQHEMRCKYPHYELCYFWWHTQVIQYNTAVTAKEHKIKLFCGRICCQTSFSQNYKKIKWSPIFTDYLPTLIPTSEGKINCDTHYKIKFHAIII